MPDQPTINFNNILRDERKSKLVPLENDFYDKAAQQILRLEDEKTKIEDIYCTKYAIIEDELKTSRKAFENIIERRAKKIITEASIRASSKQGEKQDIDSLTREECAFYNRLLGLMIEYRGEILEKVSNKKERKEKQVIPSQPAENRENKQNDAISEGKKDISKEYIVVRLLKDIPTFVGADGRNYTLAKEDVAVLSAVNAKALISRNAAVQIIVER
ncbi:MAG: DNA replication complex GINS family protein [Candidatus Methanoperedens sp.]|nr:DNA replication complex GINS family protein [Candidatus Methanoperedens sp.]